MIDKSTKHSLHNLIALSLLLFLLCSISSLANELPARKGLINDFAGIIPQSYEKRMDLFAQEVLNKTNSTLTVVTLKDIGGDAIDDFTNRLYEKWGVGEKGKDKGVMILLALKERKIRIEVGYGLEEIIPDGLAGQIRDTAMVPYLKKGEYGLGLLNGLYNAGAIIAKHEGVKLTGMPVVSKRKVTSRKKSVGGFSFLFLLIIFFFLLRSRGGMGSLFLLMLLGGGRGGFGGQGGFGGFGGGFGGFGGGMSGGGGASGSF